MVFFYFLFHFFIYIKIPRTAHNKIVNQTKGVISIMKATGIVRRIDDLGRVVIPKEIRRTMRIRVVNTNEI